jgi:hypothetical protein
MKAREVRELLRGKIDPAVSSVIEALAEDISVQKEQLLQLATMYDGIINMNAQIVDIAGNMRGALDQMKSVEGDEVDGPTI